MPGLTVSAYPNPARVGLVVGFELTMAALTKVQIYDMAGRLVRSLVDRSLTPGSHSINWDLRDTAGRRVSPGIYVFAVESGTRQARKRVVVLD
jgi:flagellar hook assembly protein FlgD